MAYVDSFPPRLLARHPLSLPALRVALCKGLGRGMQNGKWGFHGPHTLARPKGSYDRNWACLRLQTLGKGLPRLGHWSEGSDSQDSSPPGCISCSLTVLCVPPALLLLETSSESPGLKFRSAFSHSMFWDNEGHQPIFPCGDLSAFPPSSPTTSTCRRPGMEGPYHPR